MVVVHGDFATHDWSIVGKFGVEVLVAPLLVNGSDKHVVVNELLFVTSKDLLLELEGSAPFSVNLEISHGLSCIAELLWILDLDNSRIEGSGKVSSDLWFGRERNLALGFEYLSDLLRSQVVFG